jgi:dinuclear metal center YbgI/SA1388 family protein
MKLNELTRYLNEILQPERFNDYCPNGLQVEGKSEIHKIVTGVTASQALIDAAITANADCILVHHGYFWKSESSPIVGLKKSRIKSLLVHDVNLLAYHLPLDAHPQFGNNVMLGRQLGLPITRWLDDKNMLACAELDNPISLETLIEKISLKLKRMPQVFANKERPIKSIAWCTGAAQNMMNKVIESNVDIYISGEVSEQIHHLVQESNTGYIAAGHHATERYGVQALGEHLAERFKIKHQFIEIENQI